MDKGWKLVSVVTGTCSLVRGQDFPLVNVGLAVALIGPVLRLSAWPSGNCSVAFPGTAAIVQRETGRVVSTTGVHFRLGIALDVCC